MSVKGFSFSWRETTPKRSARPAAPQTAAVEDKAEAGEEALHTSASRETSSGPDRSRVFRRYRQVAIAAILIFILALWLRLGGGGGAAPSAPAEGEAEAQAEAEAQVEAEVQASESEISAEVAQAEAESASEEESENEPIEEGKGERKEEVNPEPELMAAAQQELGQMNRALWAASNAKEQIVRVYDPQIAVAKERGKTDLVAIFTKSRKEAEQRVEEAKAKANLSLENLHKAYQEAPGQVTKALDESGEHPELLQELKDLLANNPVDAAFQEYLNKQLPSEHTNPNNTKDFKP